MRYNVLKKLKMVSDFLGEYRLLVFFTAAIAYLELVYRLWIFKGINLDYIFPLLFALSAGAVLFLITNLFTTRVSRILTVLLTLLLVLGYAVQLIYHCIFHTPLSLYSLTGAGDALQFGDIIISAILKNIIAIILLFAPLGIIFILLRKFQFPRVKSLSLCIATFFFIASYSVSIICVNLTGENAVSQYTLYYNSSSPELSVSRLGLMTTMRLDFERLIFGFDRKDDVEAIAEYESSDADYDDVISYDGVVPHYEGSTDVESNSEHTEEPETIVTSTPEPSEIEINPYKIYNIMNVDFETLISNEKDQLILDMHKYFSLVEPTKKNEYTGIFEGNNLILITAEAFSPYAISPELTPTLYKMSKEGFIFNNFYNPIWGVSTSDGEYVACTGLIPKSGIWSFARSGKNYMPFAMGNQFNKLGYITKAYHNHSYTYYKRNISHPNMGYEFKAVGNGLEVKKTWPESDLEMIEVTAPEFIGLQPFHTYYMTVSGHMNYNFTGNFIARKNKQYVESLPYSDASKAYIACNMELEFAIKALIEKLEAAGIADKTVIAISPDHYPYGLPRECIDELAGHKVENNFELYKSTFILWKKGIDPVAIDKACSSLDIMPTLSNLFGLEYDSRVIMGRDILSEASPLVIFSNRSWITDRAKYNAVTNTVTYTDENEEDTEYVKAVNKAVADKFKYSARILDTDYYSKVVSQNSQR